MSVSRDSTSRVVAIRGAIDVAADTSADMRSAVAQLVERIGTRNGLETSDIISAQFTVTPDLVSGFPATAARMAGWTEVPMLCSTAVDVPNALPRCVRVLVHAYLPGVRKPEHVYLGAAVRLRPDLSVAPSDSHE